jgi:hypothetical protein
MVRQIIGMVPSHSASGCAWPIMPVKIRLRRHAGVTVCVVRFYVLAHDDRIFIDSHASERLASSQPRPVRQQSGHRGVDASCFVETRCFVEAVLSRAETVGLSTKDLAYSTDTKGRRALDVATAANKERLYRDIMLLGR